MIDEKNIKLFLLIKRENIFSNNVQNQNPMYKKSYPYLINIRNNANK